jgi:predicted nuclease with TOPRIM domain
MTFTIDEKCYFCSRIHPVMTSKDQHLINELKHSFRRLIDSLEKTRDELKIVRDENQRLQWQLDTKNDEFEALKKRYENLKVAKAFVEGDPDNQAAKQKINKIIREVDQCIALLNQ